MATLLIASNGVQAFIPASRTVGQNGHMSTLTLNSQREPRTALDYNAGLYDGPDTKSDTKMKDIDAKEDDTIEEKAWKIVKETTKDVESSSNSTLTVDEPEVETGVVEAVVETPPEKVEEAKEKVEEKPKAVVEAAPAEEKKAEEKVEALVEPEPILKEEVEATEKVEEIKATTDDEKKEEKETSKKVEEVTALDEVDLVLAIEEEAEALVDAMMDDECEIDEEGNPADEVCVDESKFSMVKSKLKGVVKRTIGLVRTGGGSDLTDDTKASESLFGDDDSSIDFDDQSIPEGELLERGWEKRGNSSALRRNAEVWKFALSCVFKALKPKKLRKKGATEEEIQAAKIEAATFIRNGLLKLGPSFVKLVSILLAFLQLCAFHTTFQSY